MGAGFTVQPWTVSPYFNEGLRKHLSRMESFRRLVETGDGPVIHAVDATAPDDVNLDMAWRASVVAIILDPGWGDRYLNTRAAVLAERYRNMRMKVAFLGVPRKRLAKHVQALASWVVAEP